MSELQKLEETKEKLDNISPSFCLAKWLQVTLHLQTGHTHSCHHPNTHKIPLPELEDNPSAIHNTEYKKSVRKQMLEGVRPKECNYCWHVEDNNTFSDRVYKSSEETWASPNLEKVLETKTENINPTYLEISFDNTCNLKCAYCAPNISSSWMQEIKQYGGYPTSNRFNDLENIKAQDKMPYLNREVNPYVDAFWDWWPDLVQDLKIFRITGGEPLLSKDLWKVLEYFTENPQPDIELAINANLSVEQYLIDKLIEKVIYLRTNNCVKNVTIFTSVDTVGKQAEYIRFNQDYDYFNKNVDLFLNKTQHLTGIHLSYMITVNALSVVKTKELMQDILYFKETYKNVGMDTPHLTHPHHMSIEILTDEFIPYMQKAVDFVKENVDYENNKFTNWEANKLERIVTLMQNNNPPFDVVTARKDFVAYFQEYDRRRNTNFLETFPEYKTFWNFCRRC